MLKENEHMDDMISLFASDDTAQSESAPPTRMMTPSQREALKRPSRRLACWMRGQFAMVEDLTAKRLASPRFRNSKSATLRR